MTRATLRWAVVVAGVVLLIIIRLAPGLPSSLLLPATLLAAALLSWLMRAGYLVLRTGLGAAAAVGIVGVLAVGPIVLTALPTSPTIATYLPCPRNWTWVPSWTLRPSPTGSIVLQVGGSRVKICYGRPAARGRTMIGGKYVPYGRLWRTGANEPTILITPIPLSVAGIAIPSGRVSLYSIPGPESWEIIVNRATSQWGLESEYSEAVRAQELGHAIVPSTTSADPVERFTITAGRGGFLLAWESTRVRIPLESGSR